MEQDPGHGHEPRDRDLWLLDQAGVAEVECFFPRRWRVVTDWFDERIEARLETRDAPAP